MHFSTKTCIAFISRDFSPYSFSTKAIFSARSINVEKKNLKSISTQAEEFASPKISILTHKTF